MAGLAAIDGARLFGPPAGGRVAVVSMTLEGLDCQELAASLDSAYRIQTRPGLHCAPAMHRALGTLESGGTVRFSMGATTTAEEVDSAIEAVRAISSAVLNN